MKFLASANEVALIAVASYVRTWKCVSCKIKSQKAHYNYTTAAFAAPVMHIFRVQSQILHFVVLKQIQNIALKKVTDKLLMLKFDFDSAHLHCFVVQCQELCRRL